MEPLSVILTAIVTGAATALKPTAEQAIKDAYDGLKRLIQNKYGDKEDVASAVNDVETKPDAGWPKEKLKEELANAGADKDEELLKAAQELLEKADPEGSKEGRYVTAIRQQARDNAIQIARARDVTIGRDK